MSTNTATSNVSKVSNQSAVPSGYKRTEIGVIPHDWPIAEIGEIAEIVTGSTPPTQVVGNYGSDWPFVSPVDIGGRPYVQDTQKKLSAKGFATCRQLPSGSVLFTCIGSTIGKCAISLTKLATNQQINSLLPSLTYCTEFVYYVLHGASPRIKRIAGKQAVPIINKNQFSKIRIPFPGLAEQYAIAEVLSDVDDLIGALEKLIAKKRAIKQATMQQLLTGKTRLSGFFGLWKETTIGDVVDIRSGSTPSTQVPAYWNGLIPWCTPTDITGTCSKYLERTDRNITEAGLASCAASLLPPGTILLCSRATIGELKIARTHVCTNQGFKSLVCHDGTSHEFLYYLIQMLKSKLIERAIGSTFLEIGKRDLAAISLTIPLENEQVAIAKVLSDMDAEIAALEHRRDKTQQIKQGMMQQLLTGRIRLIDGGTTA